MDDQTNYYKCDKCLRIAATYPFGCKRPDCPVKPLMRADMAGDGIFLLKVFIGIVLFCALIIFGSPYVNLKG